MDRVLYQERKAGDQKDQTQNWLGQKLKLADAVNQDLESQRDELAKKESILQLELDEIARKKDQFEKECQMLRE